MESDDTSEVEVKNPKLRKRMKKRDKSEDTADNNIEQIEETSAQKVTPKRRKRKLLNGTSNERSNKEENNFVGATNKNEEDSDSKVNSSRKLQRSTTINTNSCLENTEGDESEIKKPKQPSKRQLKREKLEKKENEKKEAFRLEAMKKGLNYVSKWKHARSEWKFEKLRQIWLIDNLLDETCIPDEIFPTVLEYFEGCKGMAREQLLKKGMDVIKKIEENEENKDEMETVAYQRARQLLQALPTET